MHGKNSTGQTVRYLNSAFARAQRTLGSDNRAGTKLYAAQVDFMYLLDMIQRGPSYLVPKAIAEANELIEQVNSGTSVSEAA